MIIDKNEFAELIELTVKRDSSVTYIEAIVDYCAKNKMEVEIAVKLLTPSLKAKIAKQAKGMNLLT